MAAEQILIADDDYATAQVIQIYLENLGFKVPAIAHNSVEVLEKTRELNPNLVLMDIQLGKGLDGIDVAEVIINQLNIPVIYVSAYHDEKTLERAQLTKPAGFINKPVRDSDLKTAMCLALDKSEQNAPRKMVPQLEQALNQVYNLTPAESRVVSKLLDNPNIESAADALHISISTLRTHLRHIYRKTDTNRQSALFHKIVTGPVAMVTRSYMENKE